MNSKLRLATKSQSRLNGTIAIANLRKLTLDLDLRGRLLAVFFSMTGISVGVCKAETALAIESKSTKAVQLNLGSIALPQSPALWADTTRPNNSTFVLGEMVGVIFHVAGIRPLSNVAISVVVRDEFGTTVASDLISGRANKSGEMSTTYIAPAKRYGYFRLDASLADGKTIPGLGSRPPGFVTYAIVQNPKERVNYGDTSSRFGMQGGFSVAQGSLIPYLGIRYVLAGPGWADLESKRPGQFSFDRQVAQSKGKEYPEKGNATYGVVFDGKKWDTYGLPLITTAKLPAWAIEAGTSGSVCKTMGALNHSGAEALPGFARAFANWAATSFPIQDTRYYQITWEPAKWCFGGSPKQLLQIFQLAYSAIHLSDPKAIVVGPTLFPEDENLMHDLIQEGLAASIDGVSMHPYAKWPPEINGLAINIRTQMNMVRKAKNSPVPFIGTEHGYNSTDIGELNQAYGNIRSTLIVLGEGFQLDFAFYIADFWSNFGDRSKFYGYYWNLNPNIPFGTDKVSPKPVAAAFSALTNFLDGSVSMGPLQNLGGSQIGYKFDRQGTTITAIWDYEATLSSASLPVNSKTVELCDWMGNCRRISGTQGRVDLKLGAAPIYVVERSS